MSRGREYLSAIQAAWIANDLADRGRLGNDRAQASETRANGVGEAEPYPEDADAHQPTPPELSDDALALAFTERHAGDLRYVAPWGKWYSWSGARWREDRTVAVYDMARAVCREAAEDAKFPQLARQVASAKTVAAVERMARSDTRQVIVPEQLDADRYALNTPAGTIDLRSGELREHRRGDLLTKLTAVSPDVHADDALWEDFLGQITCGDKELADYLQRLVGYALCGDIKDHVLAFFYGTGANGKSTFLDLLLYIFGDYARQVPSETLMETRNEQHPTVLANLMGTRLAISSELEEGQHWAESRIKSLTGDAVLTGRFMRQDFFEFPRTHKHIIAGNHKPSLRIVDEAIRRRIHLIPFTARFLGDAADRDMPVKLREAAPAVLAWAVRGCLEWQIGGLCPPSTVMDATAEYLAAEDTLGTWIDECCSTKDASAKTRSSVLYGGFRAWKEARGERAPSQVRFSAQMEQRFVKESGANHCRVFQGIRFREPEDTNE